MKISVFHGISLALLIASSVSPSQAAGVVALKEQSFHADASATVLVYQKIIDDRLAPFVKFETAKGVVSIDRLRIAAMIESPSSLPVDITEASHIESLRKSLEDLSVFSRRFPKSSQALAGPTNSLSTYISNFDNGQRMIKGKWFTSQEYADRIESEQKEKQRLNSLELAKKEWQIESATEAKKLADSRLENARLKAELERTVAALANETLAKTIAIQALEREILAKKTIEKEVTESAEHSSSSTSYSTPSTRFTMKSDGNTWNAASESEKREIARRMAAASNSGNSANYYYDIYEATYDSTNPGVLRQPMDDVSRMTDSLNRHVPLGNRNY